jgi:WhiB family redox-sensing transcriptional regulator
VFFPDRGDNVTARRAEAICNGCPVRRQCLDFAITNNELAGVWGGFSRKARKRIRKRREAAA